MAEANRKWSPYRYGYNNPLRFIDPDGMLEDWVKNEETQKYQWMDNVTSAKDKDIPQGYKYVGSSDEDIVADLNLPQKLEVKTENRTADALDGDNKTGIVVESKADTKGNIVIKANVSYSNKNVSSNNSLGKRFEGISITANFTQSSSNGNSEFEMNYKGYLSVKYGDENYTSVLSQTKGSYYEQSGTTNTQATVLIPARSLNSIRGFFSATISAGTTNENLFKSPKPITMTWSLMRNPIFYKSK